jgi:hypothetical protein
LALKIQAGSSSKRLVDFEKAMVREQAGEVKALRERVERFAMQFPFPSLGRREGRREREDINR